VAERRALPLASDGWQMFQAPLYYVLSAGLYEALAALLDEGSALRALRIVPLLAGMAQVQIAFVAMGYAFPERDSARALGTLAGGLLPVNLYMSHYVGNEPLAGCLSAAVIALCLRGLRHPDLAARARFPIALGALLGLAMLAKITALLLLAPAVATLLWCAPRAQRPASLARLLAAVALVAGWYLARNWIAIGKPLVLSSDNTAWWQQPGYRTPADFLRLGEALVRPVFAGMHGLGDALYSTLWLDGQLGSAIAHETRPPWDYPTMLSMAWLSLLPSGAMLIGAIAILRRRQPAGLLALGCLALYLGAVAQQFLQLGIYSAGKASYTLGLVPCWAVLAAAGLDALARNGIARAAVFGGMACWAVFAYVGYFVR
jgi:4-amino-4-deoxy-L-arabinose transferase-like glycosyltransferase